ncbi:progestin and adipoQ receptor family member 3-like isoform X2 [Rhopilema esculentum]|uniref:progestin and adipoQ receptor family member 3-like isoform X2 n=1 Tax=Rhopilema esculentum TaxID=499914 RepID=UPI0031E2019D
MKLFVYEYKNLPKFLQQNSYIVKGYRVELSNTDCFKSILMWTNESINIWTHLIGGLWFLLMIIYDNIYTIPGIDGTIQDNLVVTTINICFAACMLLSAGFHTFCCHSALSYKRWLALDLAGISMSLVGMYISSLFYGFYCNWRCQYFYTGLVSAFLIICTYLHTKEQFLAPHWAKKRIILYSCLVLFGVIPATHWYFLMGGWSSSVVRLFMPKLMVMYALGCSGLVVYVSKLPERIFPGWFDYIGCSHQWWHLLVLCALLWFRDAALQLIVFQIENSCKDGHI